MDKNIKSEYITFTVIAMISLAMVTKLFPWIIMPKTLTTLQFAWRMLAFFEFALSIICAINLYYFVEMIAKDKENLYNVLFAISIALIIVSMVKIDYNYSYEDEKNLTDEEYEAQIAEITSIWLINREYLPERVDTKALGKSYLDHRDDRVYVLDGNATITNEKKEDLQLEFDIEDYEAYTILELPYIYYLGYTVTTEQNEKIQMFESDNGMLAIKLDENIESAHITVKYTGTTIEKVSYFISAISIITFIGYVIYSKKQDI